MEHTISRFKSDYDRLVKEANILPIAFAKAIGALSETDEQKHMKRLEINAIPRFDSRYEKWYSESLVFLKQVLPDRLTDFTSLYKNDKRKEINHLTYTISDYLLGITIRSMGKVITDGTSALPKLLQQSPLKTPYRQSLKKAFGILSSRKSKDN